MPCYRPMKGFPFGKTKNGKDNFYITSFDVKHIEITGDQVKKVYHDGIISPFCDKAITEFIEIPCGRCIGCRLDYAKMWADRCMMEASKYSDNCFVTLTYDDEHLTYNESIDPDTGVVNRMPTLVKRDVQLFMKRLRKRFGNDIRFFCCGEYGDKTHRPHYHLILFNFKFKDLTVLKRSFSGDYYYTSDELSKIWTNGNHLLGDCTWNSCNYVARYITKKQYGKDAIYEKINVLPPFLLMSRRPGLARDFYELNKEQLYRYEKYYLSSPSGSLAITPPRYFDKLYELDSPEEYARLKEKRISAAKDCSKIKSELSSLEKSDQFKVDEQVKINRTKVLSRKEL